MLFAAATVHSGKGRFTRISLAPAWIVPSLRTRKYQPVRPLSCTLRARCKTAEEPDGILVLREGTISAGSRLRLLERSCPEWTVASANDVMHQLTDDIQAAQSLAGYPALAITPDSTVEQLRARTSDRNSLQDGKMTRSQERGSCPRRRASRPRTFWIPAGSMRE